MKYNPKQYLAVGFAAFALGAFYVAFIYKGNTPGQAFLFPFAIMALLAGIGLFIFGGIVYGFRSLRKKYGSN